MNTHRSPRARNFLAGLTPNTFLLALSSLFGDVSNEMLYPVLPVFLTQTLGASPEAVGLIEGVATSIQNITQGLSGYLADRLRHRKWVALPGYILAAISKPIIGFATGWPLVLFARSLDRFGTGTRSAPRDALVAESADEKNRGKAFGLESFGDNLGACLGPLITIALISLAKVGERTIFFVAIIPGALAALMILFVREKPDHARAAEKIDLHIRNFPKEYWRYLIATALFGIGNSSSSFLILRTKDLGASLILTILIYALFNFVAALSSLPAGHYSDSLGRRRILFAGYFVFAIAYAGFAFTPGIASVAVFFALYGLYQGIFRAVGKALATDYLPQRLHASGIGYFTTTVGLSGLVASIVAGRLWTHVSPRATFLYGAACALAGSFALLVLVPKKKSRR